MEMSKSKFKPKSLEYFRKVQETGEEIIITDRRKPVLKIITYTNSDETLLKLLKNSVIRYDMPFEAVAEGDWELI